MESLNRIFLFLLVGMFLISFTSAGLLDPNSELEFYEESKNGKYGYYEINDTDFWFFNNKQVKTIELIENDYSVLSAWNIKEYNIYRPTRLFDKTNYLDKEQKKDMSVVISSETHLYREWETKTRTITSSECLNYETSVNGTQLCLEYNSYEEEYEEWSKWKLYNFQIVKEGLYQTKTIVTRDKQRTGIVDWVDENEGWDLSEWATWWDTDWKLKREIKIQENSATTINNYTVLLKIPYNANMKVDFSDLRFLDSTETTELGYWVENKTNSISASIWVKIPTLISSINTSIYMYYFNPSVSSTQNISEAWLWGDDATTNKLSEYTTSGTTAWDSGNENYDIGSVGAAFRGKIQKGIFGDGEKFRLKFNSGSSGFPVILFHTTSNFETSVGSGYLLLMQVGADRFEWVDASVGFAGRAVINSTSFTTIANTDYIVDISKTGLITKIELFDENLLSLVNLTSTDNTYTSGYAGFFAWDNVFEVDDFSIGNFTFPEPTYTIGSEEIQLGVTTVLLSPENNENILSNTVNFTFTSIPTKTNLTNSTLYIWNSTGIVETNFTLLSGNESINTTFINTLVDGMYEWNAETCGENASCDFASSNNSFIVHVTPITIDISEPNGTIPFITIGDNQTLSWNLTEPGENLTEHLTNCSFTYNSIITYLPLINCTLINITSFEYVNGLNTLEFNTTDIFNLTSNKTTTWEYTIVELNQTFEENISEGALDDFSLLLNISDSSSLTDATFSYNGTNYTTTIAFSGGLYLVSSLITSPTVDANTNFSFNFFFTVDGINYTTSINQQLVVNSLFSVCGGISNDTLLNMSLFDEGSGINITGNIEIIATIVSQSSGITVGAINNTFSDVEYGAICFTPESAYSLYFLNTEIKYTSDGYVSELYYIQNSDMTDYPRNLSLFPLNQTDSTEFVVTFQNDAFIFVEGAIIQLQRKYIGENVFKTVEAPITADGGKAIVHIDLNTNIYRASIVKDGELLKFFDEIVFSCENELAGECTQSLRGDVNPNNDVPIESLLDFSYSVSVSDENNTVEVLFAIPSGTPSSVNVLLTQIDMFGNSTSCNTTVITSAGSISCDFSDTIEKSILQLTISKDGTQLAITNYGVDPELDMDGMNFFIVFLFLISLVGMAIASPEWMMIIGVMVFMISGTLLLLKGMSLAMGLGAMAWLVVAVIIIILKMAKQEDR